MVLPDSVERLPPINAAAVGGGSGAPVGAEYLVAALHADLTAERAVADTATVDWDFSVPGVATATVPASSIGTAQLGGDITAAGKAILDDADAAAQRVTLGIVALALTEVDVAFTDGHTHRRVNIVDAGAGATSKFLLSIRRPDTTEPDDKGYVYKAEVVRRLAGSFDVALQCSDWGGEDPTSDPPNETIKLCYQIG